jgi:UPF0716 protein FxsA
MAFLLLIAFIAVPIAEIAIFIRAGEWIGLWPTLGAIVATAVIGTALMRHQGLSILGSVNAEIAAGRLPVAQMFDGVCVLVAGVLLLTPGFLTDAVGLALLTPPVRRLLRGWLAWHLQRSTRTTTWRADPGTPRRPGGRGGPIIDAEYHEVAEYHEADDEPPPSPHAAAIEVGDAERARRDDPPAR